MLLLMVVWTVVGGNSLGPPVDIPFPPVLARVEGDTGEVRFGTLHFDLCGPARGVLRMDVRTLRGRAQVTVHKSGPCVPVEVRLPFRLSGDVLRVAVEGHASHRRTWSWVFGWIRGASLVDRIRVAGNRIHLDGPVRGVLVVETRRGTVLRRVKLRGETEVALGPLPLDVYRIRLEGEEPVSAPPGESR